MDLTEVKNGLMLADETMENFTTQGLEMGCPKDVNCYVADWRCKGNCPHYRVSSGWSWLGDECALANKF